MVGGRGGALYASAGKYGPTSAPMWNTQSTPLHAASTCDLCREGRRLSVWLFGGTSMCRGDGAGGGWGVWGLGWFSEVTLDPFDRGVRGGICRFGRDAEGRDVPHAVGGEHLDEAPPHQAAGAGDGACLH